MALVRVLLACPYEWDAPGGVQVHVRELARELRRRGHDVLVLAPGRQTPSEPWVRVVGRPVGVPYNRSTAPICPSPSSARRVGAMIGAFRPDVVHAHEPLAPSTSLFAVLRASAPVVATFHANMPRSLVYDVAAPVLKRVARRIDVPIAVSEVAASFASARIGGAFRIVPNGLDTRAFEEAMPAELPGERRIAFVGRLHPRKGFAVAAQAFARLAEEDPGLWLVVAGDGPEAATVERLPSGVRRRVRFLGRVDHDDLPPVLAGCDLLLAPSLGGESFGVVVVDGFAAGLPVIASDIPGYREVVRDGVSGLLVPPSDPGALARAAGRVLADPDLAERLASAGKERARDFSWELVAGRLESLYAEAADRFRPRPLR